MKTYTEKQIKSMAANQGYKFAALENLNGERLVSFNAYNKPVMKQLDTITLRLKAEAIPDGLYYVLFAHSIAKMKNPDRYAIQKGKVTQEAITMAESRTPQTLILQDKTPEVLTWKEALAMKEEIANLRAENARLQAELTQALEELDEEPEEISEGSPRGWDGITTMLKDSAPGILSLFEKHLELRERRLNLDEMKLSGSKPKQKQRKPIVPGTQEHMNVIEYYFKEGKEEKLNAELDRLQEVNQELYKQVLDRLGIEEEGEEQAGTSEQEDETE